jgi:hypothetical protein
MHRIMILLALSIPVNSALALTTQEQVKSLSQNLAAGQYHGNNSFGEACNVTVVDNGADGSGYTISISPLSGKGNPGVASATILPNIEDGYIGDTYGKTTDSNSYQEVGFAKFATAFQVSVQARIGQQTKPTGADCWIR